MKAKALILLFVFLLNTVAGFGCAIHMAHKGDHEVAEHHEVAGHHEHQHTAVSTSHEAIASQATTVSTSESCCQGSINNFISQAKQLPVSNSILLIAPFIYVSHPIDSFLNPVTELHITKLKVIDERKRPPDRDIRIALKSFLI